MMERFSLADIFSKAGRDKFHSSNITSKELEALLKDVVEQEHPKQKIKNFEFVEDGAIVTLDNDDVIEIEVDWQEIILS